MKSDKTMDFMNSLSFLVLFINDNLVENNNFVEIL
jgi:hypothetical protein